MSATVITDPRLLPLLLTTDEVASVVRRKRRTVEQRCAAGIWREGREWVRDAGGRRMFVRDRILELYKIEIPEPAAPAPPNPHLGRSATLSAAWSREHGV